MSLEGGVDARNVSSVQANIKTIIFFSSCISRLDYSWALIDR